MCVAAICGGRCGRGRAEKRGRFGGFFFGFAFVVVFPFAEEVEEDAAGLGGRERPRLVSAQECGFEAEEFGVALLGLGFEGLDAGGEFGGLAAPLFLFEDGGLVLLEALLVAGVGLGDRVEQGFDLLALVGGGLFKGGEGLLLLFECALSLSEDADLALGEGDALSGVSSFGGEAFALFLEDLDLFLGFVVLFSGLEEAFADLFVLLNLLFEYAGLFFVSGGALESEACGARAFGGALVAFEPKLVEAFGEAFFLGEGRTDAKGLEGIVFGG